MELRCVQNAIERSIKMQDNKYILAKSFVVHKDSLNILEELTDEEAGKLIKAIFKYQVTGEVEKLERGLHFIFTGFVNQFKRDQEKYIHKCEVNKENRTKKSSGIVTNDNESSGIVTNGTDKDSKKEKDSNSDNNKENKSKIESKKELDRNHVFFSGFDDKTINALLDWFQYQQEHFNLKIDNGYLKSLKPIIEANIEAGNDIEYSVNFIMSSRNADGSRTKTLRYFPNPNAEAKNKNLSPEERKKQKDAQLKKEDRDRILSNYCKGVTYEEAYLTLNKKRKGEIEHYPLRVAEVITKSECDKYMIKYPTRGDWELLNTEREEFLLTIGNFLEEDCK